MIKAALNAVFPLFIVISQMGRAAEAVIPQFY
jgi:hypothetical protein